MPLNPRRMEAVFLKVTDYHDPVDASAVLDRECSADLELHLRSDPGFGQAGPRRRPRTGKRAMLRRATFRKPLPCP
jgi:hypothetical protein